jgi:hypothetical protein
MIESVLRRYHRFNWWERSGAELAKAEAALRLDLLTGPAFAVSKVEQMESDFIL